MSLGVCVIEAGQAVKELILTARTAYVGYLGRSKLIPIGSLFRASNWASLRCVAETTELGGELVTLGVRLSSTAVDESFNETWDISYSSTNLFQSWNKTYSFFSISTTFNQRILYHVLLSYQLSLSVIVISVKCILGERSWLRALRIRYKYVLCQSKFSFFFSERFQFQVFRKRTSLMMVLINQPQVGRLTRLFLNSRYVIGPVLKNSNANI